jgi:hypothetical protein
MRRIFQKDLNFHPYKITVVQELIDRDMAIRTTAAELLIGILSDDIIILMTNETYFHLSDCVNKQNFRYWSEESPQQLHPHSLHSGRVPLWCGVANFGVTGPQFFGNEDGHAVTVTAAR